MSIAYSQAGIASSPIAAPDEPAIHWPSAIVGLGLALAVALSVTWLASVRRPEVESPPQRVAAPVEPAVTPAPTPIPPPVSQPAPVEQVKVSFTRGVGVNLRAGAGERAARIKTLAEGSVLELVGPDQQIDGIVWRNVREPGGATGWVAAQFLASSGRAP